MPMACNSFSRLRFRSQLPLFAALSAMLVGLPVLAQSPAPTPAAVATPSVVTPSGPDEAAIAGGNYGGKGDVVDAGGSAFVPADPGVSDDDKTKAEKTKAVNEFKASAAKEPLSEKLAESVGQNRVAINTMWTLLTGFLVMFMQAGFAMVESGFTRAKHAVHVMMTNFMIYPLGMIGFWICGFAFMFGSVGGVGTLGLSGDVLNAGNPWIGLKGFFLQGVYHPAVYTLFLFQMVFMDTTCTIPTGAMAERWKFSAFMVYGLFISMIIYPLYGHQIWGLGFLSQLHTFGMGHGAVDFAGSGVVHAVGGFVALAGAIVIGPRIGKYGPDMKPRPIPGHNLPMAIIGTFILAFGWFGFNPGSTLGVSGGGGLRVGIVAVNTMIASAGGAFAALFYWWAKYKKPDPSMAVNGMLAGLVAITAPCAFTNSVDSFIIGVIGGILVCIAVPLVENKGIDDPVGAFSVHGVNGIWGVIAVGLFADGTYGSAWNGGPGDHGVKGLLHGGGFGQLEAQLISAIVCMVWSFGTGFLFFKVQHAVMGIRSKESDEIEGLDMPEMGSLAYPHEEDYAHL